MPTYEEDVVAWSSDQARLIRAGRFDELDIEHIAEEIEDLGKSEPDMVYSLARQIIQHLLLVEHSPATEQRRHWMDQIDEFRAQTKHKL